MGLHKGVMQGYGINTLLFGFKEKTDMNDDSKHDLADPDSDPWDRLFEAHLKFRTELDCCCLLYTSPSPRDATLSRMPSSA